MSIPYTAHIHYTGDVQILVKGETYFDDINLYEELDNYDIVYEDETVASAIGAMTSEQFHKLKESNERLD